MRWRWPAAAGLAACIGLGLGVLVDEGEAVPGAAPALSSAPVTQTPPSIAAAPPEDRAARRRQLVEQVRLTDHTYCSYLAHSRYPHESRPAGHHPDQLYPNQPLLETNPMRADGGDSHPDVRLQSAQSRVYLAAGERADFSLRALDGSGQPLPLEIGRAHV